MSATLGRKARAKTDWEEVLATTAGVLAGSVVGVLVFVVLALPLVMWTAFVMRALWGWFVVPLGGPVLPFPLAVGLMLLLRHCQQAIYLTDLMAEEQKRGLWKTGVWRTLLAPALTLGLGWIVHLWAGGR